MGENEQTVACRSAGRGSGGVVMDGWEQIKLGDLCEFRRGLTYKKADEVAVSSNAILRANNITVETGEINYDEIRFIRGEIEIPTSRMVVPGGLLVCTASGSKNHLGKIGLIEDGPSYAFGGFMGLIVPSERALPKFLFYLTRSNLYRDFIHALSDGININNLKWSQLSQFQVPIPPLPEQEQIVAILDEAFAAIETATANIKKNIANARELFASQLAKVFSGDAGRAGWTNLMLSEVLNLQYGKPLPKEYRSEKGKFPAYGANGIKCRTNNVYWEKPSIVVGRKGSAGALNLVDGGFWPLDVTYFVILDERKYVLRFLYYMLSRLDLPSLARGVKPGLNRNDVYAIKQYIPHISEQNKIVSLLDKFSGDTQSIINTYNTKLNALTELKQSLLHKAFSGELVTNSKSEVDI